MLRLRTRVYTCACLGINHFDRNNQCGTPADPDPANWQIAVPDGDYAVMVDFGESVVRTDLGGAPLQCAVEGILTCNDMAAGDTDCLYQGVVVRFLLAYMCAQLQLRCL